MGTHNTRDDRVPAETGRLLRARRTSDAAIPVPPSKKIGGIPDDPFVKMMNEYERERERERERLESGDKRQKANPLGLSHVNIPEDDLRKVLSGEITLPTVYNGSLVRRWGLSGESVQKFYDDVEKYFERCKAIHEEQQESESAPEEKNPFTEMVLDDSSVGKYIQGLMKLRCVVGGIGGSVKLKTELSLREQKQEQPNVTVESIASNTGSDRETIRRFLKGTWPDKVGKAEYARSKLEEILDYLGVKPETFEHKKATDLLDDRITELGVPSGQSDDTRGGKPTRRGGRG